MKEGTFDEGRATDKTKRTKGQGTKKGEPPYTLTTHSFHFLSVPPYFLLYIKASQASVTKNLFLLIVPTDLIIGMFPSKFLIQVSSFFAGQDNRKIDQKEDPTTRGSPMWPRYIRAINHGNLGDNIVKLDFWFDHEEKKNLKVVRWFEGKTIYRL